MMMKKMMKKMMMMLMWGARWNVLGFELAISEVHLPHPVVNWHTCCTELGPSAALAVQSCDGSVSSRSSVASQSALAAKLLSFGIGFLKL